MVWVPLVFFVFLSVFLLHVVLGMNRAREVRELARPRTGHSKRTVVSPLKEASLADPGLVLCATLAEGVAGGSGHRPPGPSAPRYPLASFCNSQRTRKPAQATALI